MRLVFKKIKLSNFLSFESAEIDLSNRGYTLVNGINENPDDNASSNGSGKSSIWEAISWGITGETVRGTKDVKRIGSSGKCEVEVVFLADGSEYRVVRTKDPSNLKVYINGEDKSGKGIRDTEKLLSSYLPDLTASLIGSVVVLGQGLPNRFTNNTPSGRKEVLEKLSKSDFMLSDLKNRIGDRKSVLSNDLRKNEDANIELKTEKTFTEKKITELEQKLSSMNSDSLKMEIKKVEDRILSCKEDVDKYELKLKEISDDVDKYTEQYMDKCFSRDSFINSIFEKYETNISNLAAELSKSTAEHMSLAKDIEKLRNVKDVCPTCGQKLPNVHKVDTSGMELELSNIESKILKIRSDKDELIHNRDSEVEEATKNIKKEINDCSLKCDTLNKDKREVELSLDNSKRELSTLENLHTKYEVELSSFDSTVNDLHNSITKYKSDIENIDDKLLYNTNEHDEINLHLDVINKMNTAITRDFRGYLLTNVISFIDSKSKEYSMDVFNTDKIQFILDGNNISISYDGKEYENLSGGERQKVDLIVQLSIRDMMCKFLGFSSNIIVLDELFDNLDSIGCTKVLSLISSKLVDVDSIFIVTHHSDISIPSDNEITVVKGTDKISRVR